MKGWAKRNLPPVRRVSALTSFPSRGLAKRPAVYLRGPSKAQEEISA